MQEMTAQFTIEGTLPGLNEIVGQARYNRFAGASQKKRETKRCAIAIMAGSVPTFTTPVTVHFRWIEKDLRRDPDNICAGAKFVMDSLVMLSKLPNDTRKWVKGITHDFPPPERNLARVEVRIEGVEK